MEMVKEMVSELEDISVEMIHSELTEEKCF